MKLFRFSIHILCLLLLLVACDNRKEVDMLQHQTEVMHDKAMEDLADLVRTKSALRKSLAAMDTLPDVPPLRDSILTVLADMAKADEDMKNWMVQFKSPTKETPKEEAIQYLTEQKAFIEQNAADILSATEAGKHCLEVLADPAGVPQ